MPLQIAGDRMFIRRLVSLALALVLLIAAAPSARAEEDKPPAAVEEVLFNSDGNSVLVSFKGRNLVSDQLVRTIESGLPVRFVYEVRFVRKAGYLTSGVLSDTKIERVLEKDNLKNLYRITENGVGADITDFTAAIERLGKVEGLPVAALSDLIPEKRYQAEIQIKLEEFRLPFHLHRILPFFSAWDVTTPWKTVRIPPDFLGKP